MVHEIFSPKHADEVTFPSQREGKPVSKADDGCPSCGTPVRHGVTTQYVDDLDVEICAVCEQPLKE